MIQKGSLELASSTMETYHHDLNCFGCHHGSSLGQNDLSHTYFQIQPLPTR